MLQINNYSYHQITPRLFYTKFSLATIKDYFFSHQINEDIEFEYSQDLLKRVEENEDNDFISFCINDSGFQYPVAIPKLNQYQNIVSFIEDSFGYKTGRMMEIYQRGYTKYEEGSSLELNFESDYPNIAFIQVFYIDAARYKNFYEKNKEFYTKEDFLSIPLKIFGKPYSTHFIPNKSKSE